MKVFATAQSLLRCSSLAEATAGSLIAEHGGAEVSGGWLR
jgi:hypothetical protein